MSPNVLSSVPPPDYLYDSKASSRMLGNNEFKQSGSEKAKECIVQNKFYDCFNTNTPTKIKQVQSERTPNATFL